MTALTHLQHALSSNPELRPKMDDVSSSHTVREIRGQVL